MYIYLLFFNCITARTIIQYPNPFPRH